MLVYRIVKDENRASDLTGTGAFLVGGRWNSEGINALYTSENAALAMLEVLVHVDSEELPPHLYLVTIEVNEQAIIKQLSSYDLPEDWRRPGNSLVKEAGDKILKEKACIGFKVPSAAFPLQYNYVLNPLHPSFKEHVKVLKIVPLATDNRFFRIA